jgi:N-acylneuraminate cytidylyltransferase
MIVAIIPARGGSKRVKKTKIFDEIIVTTDSKKIQNISRKAGAKIYFKRPKNLSNDQVGTFEVTNHTINYLKNRLGKNPEYACCVYPTSILIDKKDITATYKIIREGKWNFFFL